MVSRDTIMSSCRNPHSSFLDLNGTDGDGRLNGEIFASTGPWSLLPSARTEKFGLQAAKTAIFIFAQLLIQLGYTIGIEKSVLYSAKRIEYLGLVVDSSKQAFELLARKVVAFATLREEILACKKTVQVRTLKRFQLKCVSFSLAEPGAKLFMRIAVQLLLHLLGLGKLGSQILFGKKFAIGVFSTTGQATFLGGKRGVSV